MTDETLSFGDGTDLPPTTPDTQDVFSPIETVVQDDDPFTKFTRMDSSEERLKYILQLLGDNRQIPGHSE